MNYAAYIDSLNQLEAFKRRYPDGIKTYGTFGDNIHDADDCNFPKLFMAPLDLSKPIDRQAIEDVAEYMIRREQGKAKPCVVLDGCTGTGKTRAAIMAAIGSTNASTTTLFSCFTHFRFVRAVDFARIARTPHGKPLEFTGFKNPDYENTGDDKIFYDGVILDDLDKASFSANVIAELYDFIDHAQINERPLIITTQANGTDLAKMLMGKDPDAQRTGRVQSIVRRLIDQSEFIHFQKPQPKDQ